MSLFRFAFPTAIVFGEGARHELAPSLQAQQLSRPLVVSDRGLAQQAFFKDWLAELQAVGLQVSAFTELGGNPVKSQVLAGAEAYKATGADCIVGIGGGAALDVAKAIAVAATHPHDLFDYEDRPGARPIDQPLPPWFALPTTAGTGSEVGRSAVISDDQSHAKKIIFAPELMARQVFADPELTLGLPPALTAATGMDALTHLVEAFLARGYHPLCDGIALEGLQMVQRSLVQAVHTPGDKPARADMLLASLMGAVAFQKGLGLTHSCAHALSTVTDMHHGLANGIMIDHALRFNLTAVPERFDRLAQTLGLESGPVFFDWLRALKQEIGIPARLSELGIQASQIADLVMVAQADGCHANNPRPCSPDDFRQIFQEAL